MCRRPLSNRSKPHAPPREFCRPHCLYRWNPLFRTCHRSARGRFGFQLVPLLLGSIGGGMLLLVLLGVILFGKWVLSRTSEPAPGVSFSGGGLAGPWTEDGIRPRKEKYADGDRITAVGHVDAVTGEGEYLPIITLANLEADPRKREALLNKHRNDPTGYVVIVRAGDRRLAFQMKEIKFFELQPLSQGLRGKWVRAEGTLRHFGDPWLLRDCSVQVLD